MNGQTEHPPLISRRSLSQAIVGGSVGVLCAGRSSDAKGATTTTYLNGGHLEDHLAIEQLLHGYAFALDDLDSAAMAECFTPDGAFTGGSYNLRGNFAVELIANVRRQYERLSIEYARHNMMNHRYVVQDVTATGITYCIANLVASSAGARTMMDLHLRYHDELAKQGSRWLIRKRRWESLFTTEKIPVKDFVVESIVSKRQASAEQQP